MPVTVLPRPEAIVTTDNTGAIIAQGISAGVNTALSIQQAMLAQEQSAQRKEDRELAMMNARLSLFDNNPNLLPVEDQQKLVNILGLEGVREDPVTGKFVFPRSAETQAKEGLAQITLDIIQRAASGEQEAMADVRAMQGIGSPAPHPAQLQIERDRLELQRESNRISQSNAALAALARVRAAEIAAGPDVPSGIFQVGSRIFSDQSSALKFAQDAGVSTDNIRLLTTREADAVLETMAEKVKIQRDEVEILKLESELKDQEVVEPIKQLISASRAASAAGATSESRRLAIAASELLTQHLERNGVDVSVLQTADDPGILSRIMSSFGASTDTKDPFFMAFSQKVAEAQPSGVEDSGDAVGIDFATGQAIFPDGTVPFSPTAGPSPKNIEASGSNILMNELRTQLSVGLAAGMPMQDVQQQLVAELARKGVALPEAQGMVGIVVQELLAEAARGAK